MSDIISEKEWRERFAKRIKKISGWDDEDCDALANDTDYDPEYTPEDAADEEMSYWEE